MSLYIMAYFHILYYYTWFRFILHVVYSHHASGAWLDLFAIVCIFWAYGAWLGYC